MKRYLATLAAAVLLASTSSPISSAAVKAGGTCTKLNTTTISNGYKYTCIKSGKKLVWSKGVKATTPAPKPTATPSPTPSPVSVVTHKEGEECSAVGERENNSAGFLECREVANKAKKYFQISLTPKAPPTNISPENLNICRIPDQSTTDRSQGPYIAYPIKSGSTYAPIPKEGPINALIIPIDFADSPGKGSPKEIYDELIKNMNAWMKWYSHGKSYYNFQTYDKWIRAPKNSTEYVPADSSAGTPHQPELFKTGRKINALEIASEYLDLAQNHYDYKGMHTMFILYPKDIKNIYAGIWKLGNWQISSDPKDPPNTIKIKDPRLLNVWVTATGARDTYFNFPVWSFILHENLHNQGLQGHAPNQGSNFGIMTNQYGLSNPLSSWDTLTIDWQLENQFYCVQRENLQPTTLTMSPMEREEIGTKAIMIKLSKTQVLVIESRRRDRWSSGYNGFPGFPQGFYGLIVYKVDTTAKPLYGVEEPDGANWRDYSDAYAYLIRNQEVDHGYIPGAPQSSSIDKNFLIYEGESLTTNGIKISLVKSGDHDQVKVERIGDSTPTPSATPTPSPSPTPSATPTPSPSATQAAWKDPLEGTACEKENDTKPNQIYELKCLKYNFIYKGSSNENLIWAQNFPPPGWKPNSESTASPSPNNSPAPVVKNVAGERCLKVGQQVPDGDSLLECRYIKSKQLVWISINKTPKPFTNPASAQSIETCKIQGEIDGNHLTGFGVDISLRGKYGNFEKRTMPAVGVNESIVVPVDFVDFPGDANLSEILTEQKENMQSWVKYFSAGKLQFNVATYDSWIRMPEKAEYYNQTDYNLSVAVGGQDRITQIAQLYIDVITKKIDLTKYKTVYILYPSKQNVIATDLVPRMVQFKVKEGTTSLSVFARSTYDWGMQTPFWVFYLHETGHDWGLYGHAPGNGWPLGLMVNQSLYSQALFSWERFLLSWLPDDQVYCDTKSTLKTAEIKLSAVERDDLQTKMIGIKLDSNRLLVIESHGNGKWTSLREKALNSFNPLGFYGVIAYVVDSKFTVDRPFVKPDGSVLNDDDGVSRAIPRYTYMYPIDDLTASHEFRLASRDKPVEDYGRYTAVQGDTITIEGIKISVLSTGDYETVKIEKVG